MKTEKTLFITYIMIGQGKTGSAKTGKSRILFKNRQSLDHYYKFVDAGFIGCGTTDKAEFRKKNNKFILSDIDQNFEVLTLTAEKQITPIDLTFVNLSHAGFFGVHLGRTIENFIKVVKHEYSEIVNCNDYLYQGNTARTEKSMSNYYSDLFID